MGCRYLLAAVLCSLTGAGAVAAPAVTNGSFESPPYASVGGVGYTTSVAGWTPVEATSMGINTGDGPFHDNGVVPTGNQVLFLQAQETQVSGVSQVVTGFEAGKEYLLVLYVNARAGDTPDFATLEVRFGGGLVYGPQPWTPGGYQRVEVDLGAPGAGSFNLQIAAALGTPGGPALLVDGVTIIEKGEVESYELNGWPQLAPFLDTQPTLDGTVSPNEYGPYGNKPVVVSRETLGDVNNRDLLGRTFRQDGTYFTANAGSIDSPADGSFVAYYGWDNNAMYFAAVVQDDDISPQTASTAVNQGDAIQLCIDYDNTNVLDARDAGRVFIPSWAPVSNNTNFSHFNAFWPESNPNPFTGTTWTMSVDGASYTLEARIPWTAFAAGGDTFTTAFPPWDGMTIGVLPVLLDRDFVSPTSPAAFLFTAGGGRFVLANTTAYSPLTFYVAAASADEVWALYQ